MSEGQEAREAEQEVEDLFSEQILGVQPPPENPSPMPEGPPPEEAPEEAPPEPKPVEEITVEEAAEEEEQSDEEEEAAPEAEDEEEAAAEPEEPEPTEEELVAAWARKKYGDDISLETESERKFAKSAYEQEKLLGRKAEETRLLQEQQQQRDLQERIDALNTPGNLTPEEDNWVDEAVTTNDPGEYAYDALQAGRPDLYAAVMDRWSSQGESESRMARILHSRVLQAVSQPLPSEQESYTQALGQTFVSLGLNIEQHGPLILTKAEELGAEHPAVVGMMSSDDDVRRIATRAVYDLVAAGRTSVQKARSDDVVSARVREEQLRQAAAGVNSGGPRVEQPKKSEFWEQFDEELADRGWDGNRPVYGRD